MIGAAVFAALLPSATLAADLIMAMEEDPALQQIAAEYYRERHGVELDEAYRRLAIQDRASGIEDELERVLGAQYAGIWFDPNDHGRLKIGMTKAAIPGEKDVRAALDRLSLSPDSDLVAVRFTEAELERQVAAMSKALSRLLDGGRVTTGYSTQMNRVTLTAVSNLSAEETRQVEQVGREHGAIVDRVNVPTLRGQLQSCGVRKCNKPFRGGREIIAYNLGVAHRCTAAFIARHRVSTKWLVMTAGHCLTSANFASWWSEVEHPMPGEPTYSGRKLGPTDGWVFPGTDAGVIAIAAGFEQSWLVPPAPMPWVVVKGSGQTTYNPEYPIKKDGKSSLGSIKCITGRDTGTHCGQVVLLGFSGSVEGMGGNSATVHNMGVIAACVGKKGDSGGPVYKTNTAYGIYLGTLPIGDGCFEVYQGIRGAENALNVDVQFTP